MNFEYHLYQYLLKHQKAEVPDFGVFELTKESAKIDAENSIITPPKEVVAFHYQPSVFENYLAKYIAEENNSNLFTVEVNLKNEVAKWFQKLQSENNLYLENLGHFQLDDQNKVIKITDNDDDVFGLESINLQNLKKSFPKKNINSENYSFNKNVIWTFLSIIILGTISLFLFANQELIFGKSSQIPTKKIVRKAEPKKVLATPETDSIKIDSIKPKTNAKIQKINR
jgi:nucleoid DNA-binding protein